MHKLFKPSFLISIIGLLLGVLSIQCKYGGNGENQSVNPILTDDLLTTVNNRHYFELLLVLSKIKDKMEVSPQELDRGLNEAVVFGNQAIVQLLLDHGANVNAKTHGHAPLHRAATGDIVDLLISKGADLEIKDETFGETPLQIAVQNINNKEVIERLLKHKANIEARNKQGFTTLQLAIKIPALEPIEMVELLLEHGANANIEPQNENEDTPLHLAAQQGFQNIVQLLIKKGANIEAQNKQKDTPLHIASYFAKEEVVKMLLQYKANKDAINQNNEKPLDVARKELENSPKRLKPNYNKIIQLLTELH